VFLALLLSLSSWYFVTRHQSTARNRLTSDSGACRCALGAPYHGASVTQALLWSPINGEFVGGHRQVYRPGRQGCAPVDESRTGF